MTDPGRPSGRRTRRTQLDWPPIIAAARDIVASYDTGVTLRQLFYRLVAAQLIPNLTDRYNQLSKRTAAGRRAGTFPDLIDNTRRIAEPYWYRDPAEALSELAAGYRRNRTENQDVSIFLATEKRGLVAQLYRWFSGPYGIPVLPLGGWASQSFIDNDIKPRVASARREHGATTVLLYAGDFDASGDRIDRIFTERTPGCWDDIERLALNPDQIIDESGVELLVRQRGKHLDPNVADFVDRHGDAAIFDPANPYVWAGPRGAMSLVPRPGWKQMYSPVQVEMEALDPDDLRALFTDAINRYWDDGAYPEVLAREQAERAQLRELADRFDQEQP